MVWTFVILEICSVMIPGMSVRSYRKYTMFFDVVAILLFIGLIVYGICMFFFNLPQDDHMKEAFYFVLTGIGALIYIISFFFQWSRFRKEKQIYQPLATGPMNV